MASGICSKRTWPPATASVATPLARRETPSCRKCRQGRKGCVKAELAAQEQAILSGIQFATLTTKTTNSDTLRAFLFSSASLAARRLRQADWGADDHDQAHQGQADPPGHTPSVRGGTGPMFSIIPGSTASILLAVASSKCIRP